MFKFKLGLTLFILYELVAVILLQNSGTCYSLLGAGMCDDNFLKYFTFCFAVPLVFFILCMWVHEIIMRRRRRMFKYKAKKVFTDIASKFTGSMGGAVEMPNMEKYVSAALILMARKYVEKHPKVKEVFDEIKDIVAEQEGRDIDMDDDGVEVRKPRARTVAPVTKKAVKPTAKKRK